MYVIWLATLLLISATLEFLLTRAGIVVPLMTIAAFYAFACHRQEAAIPLSALTAALIDLALGRSLIMHVLVLSLVFLLVQQWKNRGDCTVFLLQAVPGFIVGVVWGGLMLLSESFQPENFSGALVFHNLWLLVQITVLSALLTPILFAVFDYIAEFLDQPQFVNCQTPDQQP
ncbi:MAG: hypothetical protein ACOCZS_02950 [Verrucomicrobiota bacterium]